MISSSVAISMIAPERKGFGQGHVDPDSADDPRLADKARILIVEDEKLVALDLKKRVESFGHEVCAMATTADEAVTHSRSKHPDVILMDVRLRGQGDGIEAAKEILKERYIPIVYITAFSDPDTVHRLRDMKPAGFLLKPVDISRLRREINYVLGN